MSQRNKVVYVLTLREGSFDGKFSGDDDILWNVYPSTEDAVREMHRCWKDIKHSFGKKPKAKLWIIQEAVVGGDMDRVDFYSIDGYKLERPPMGMKFTLPPPCRGRCKFVYICSMQEHTPEAIDQARCVKKERHWGHVAKSGSEFDQNCEEPLRNFPYIWTYHHSENKKERAAALKKLQELNPEWRGHSHT